MRVLRETLKLVILLVVLLACSRGGCKKADVQVKVGTLPADPLAAARELGKAAVEEKDPKKLAGKLAAFLERLKIPVVSADGKDLLVKGPMTWPPKSLFLWEPVLAGVARSTAKGDRRRFTLVARALFPKASLEDIDQIDFVEMMSEAAKDIATQKGDTADAMLITAIATDFETRATKDVNPWVDPIQTLLLGLWMTLTNEKGGTGPITEPGAMPPGMPEIPQGIPGMPPGIPMPGNMLADPSPSGCAWMEKAGTIGKAIDAASKWGKVGKWIGDNPMLSKLAKLGKGHDMGSVVMEGIAGMGIAAFVEVDGDVKPAKVKYGDGPVTYTVRVESLNPFDKKKLDSFVDCLALMNPLASATLEALKDLPAKGPMEGIPVYWDNTSVYDPRHGKFTPDKASPASGFGDQLIKAGMQLAGGSTTDSGGKATAKFQVKPSPTGGKGAATSHYESFVISAVVFPFPIKGSVVYGASNLISNRAVPLRLEIEVPVPKDWIFGFKENLFATGEGMAGGWSINMDASVPFTLGPNLDFSATGPGTWTFGFSGGAGVVSCTAPTTKYPFTLNVSGKVKSIDGMDTHFQLSDSSGATIKSKLTCSGPGGISVSAPLQGPASGSMTANTGLQSFDMPLTDGATKTFPVAHGSAKGTARVTLTAKSD